MLLIVGDNERMAKLGEFFDNFKHTYYISNEAFEAFIFVGRSESYEGFLTK